MPSKQAPVKMAFITSEGQKVHFLLKPLSRSVSCPDDYRKDAYMMDFCALLNRLFERSHDGRSRELSLRTFSVVIVAQNIGMMEWVNDSQTIRVIMTKLYDDHRSNIDPRLPTHRMMCDELAKMQKLNTSKPGQESLQVLKEQYCAYFDGIPVLFHKWFLQTYQSPNEWFSARLKFVRSLAVWSIVGYITGLGDRHADNILMHVKSGSCFHVDFECLLDSGSSLNVPERVPFRLTPNLVDAMGPSGEDGAFRTCCVVTMKVLREHRTGLISVSETFTNDPLIQWNDSNKELRKENLKV
jgi:serine/threonine-protein kinase ATR